MIVMSYNKDFDTGDDVDKVPESLFSDVEDSGSFLINANLQNCGLLYEEYTGVHGKRDDFGAELWMKFKSPLWRKQPPAIARGA